MTFDWWTFAIQAVNVLILVWILHRFLWKPVSRVIAERQEATAAALRDAQEQTRAAEAEQAEIEEIRAGISQERAASLEAARAEAEKVRQTILADAERQARQIRDKARDDIEAARNAARKEARDEAGALALDIAAKLAARLRGPLVKAVFLDALVAEIAALPSELRQSVGERGSNLRLTSAVVLDPHEETECRRRIAEALGCTPEITFSVDPALIEGMELYAEHFSILNSWRADLARIEESFAHD
ncbi:F0F1 ATP synthase subunit delta [Breoghania sp. JC706]|uniref:F0F1 ATP synthase subunit B family protein n=1 Tax=Breoghania sp. JC706 TaxID=3117732 RepID=UPI003008460B